MTTRKVPRKIVQIAGTDILYALADDATVWYRKWDKWARLPNAALPDREEPADG